MGRTCRPQGCLAGNSCTLILPDTTMALRVSSGGAGLTGRRNTFHRQNVFRLRTLRTHAPGHVAASSNRYLRTRENFNRKVPRTVQDIVSNAETVETSPRAEPNGSGKSATRSWPVPQNYAGPLVQAVIVLQSVLNSGCPRVIDELYHSFSSSKDDLLSMCMQPWPGCSNHILGSGRACSKSPLQELIFHPITVRIFLSPSH